MKRRITSSTDTAMQEFMESWNSRHDWGVSPEFLEGYQDCMRDIQELFGIKFFGDHRHADDSKFYDFSGTVFNYIHYPCLSTYGDYYTLSQVTPEDLWKRLNREGRATFVGDKSDRYCLIKSSHNYAYAAVEYIEFYSDLNEAIAAFDDWVSHPEDDYTNSGTLLDMQECRELKYA